MKRPLPCDTSSGITMEKRPCVRITTLLKLSHGLVFAVLMLQISLTHSLEISVNEDIDPCDFLGSINPPGYCYCTPLEMEKAETVRCGFHKVPAENDWRAIARLRATPYFEIFSRGFSLPQLPPNYVFSGMTSLHSFQVKGASFLEISPDAFGNSSGITEIDMPINNIRSLAPFSFSNLPNLTVIKLNYNNLTEIQRDVFVNLPQLRELQLDHNSIISLHDYALKDLKNLAELTLKDNQIFVITREVFSGLNKMKNLDLRGNSLEYIGDHVFAEMPNLQDLHLSNNSIKSISPDAFAGLAKLGRLNLRDNKLVQLQPHTFARLEMLYFLDLRNNELESLHLSVFGRTYMNLKNETMQLQIDGNRFVCDCHIVWIKTLHAETKSIYVTEQINRVTCNQFERASKQHTAVGPQSPHTVDEKVRNEFHEESTTFKSEVNVLNLTETDLNCQKHASDSHTLHRTSYETSLHHHNAPNTNLGRDSVHTEFHHDNHLGSLSSTDYSDNNSGLHHHVSSLKEPQATAALESNDVGRSAPHRNLASDKMDGSKKSSVNPEGSSVGAKASSCDFKFVLGVLIFTAFLSS